MNDRQDLIDGLEKIANGRIDNGRPLNSEVSRQIARETLIRCGFKFHRDPANQPAISKSETLEKDNKNSHIVQEETRKLSRAIEEELQNACTEISDLHQRLSAAEKERDELRTEASFLLDRLADLGDDAFNERGARDWFGHVDPSIARLRAALKNAGGNEGDGGMAA